MMTDHRADSEPGVVMAVRSLDDRGRIHIDRIETTEE
jgi:hypothetical protein